MKKHSVSILVALIISFHLFAQDTIPHVQGRIAISVKRGTIACDLTLSNMPRIDDYYLRLNSGMNIRYIKNPEGTMPLHIEKSLQDTLSSGESSAYYIGAYNASGKYLPHSIEFNYVGMYPVITDTSSAEDWRGNIAFNGTTLRADGIQSAWCPILYDVKNDKRYEKVTYDMDITCSDCNVIYLNGSQPVTGTHAAVKSSSTQDLTMFAGDFKSVAINGSYFLNPDASDNELADLEKGLQACRDYISQKLAIPYKGKSVYIQTTPVSKHNAWQFASYPTIVNISWTEGLKSYVTNTAAGSSKLYMAHELAHYYFGTYRNFNSELGDALSEGFAEFIALNADKISVNDSLYREKLKAKLNTLRNFKPAPFAAIHSKNDYNDRERYVYYYAPLLFLAIQQEIGDQKMWEWMRLLLQTPAVFTNYSFIEQTLHNAVKDEAKFKSIRERYFESDQALQTAVATLHIPSAVSPTAAGDKPVAKTYYYFFFAGPFIDIGSPQNRTITHTAVLQMTGTPDEFNKMAEPVFKRIHDECENEAGCSSDLNSYDSMDKAKSALQRWLGKFSKYKGMLVKEIKTE